MCLAGSEYEITPLLMECMNVSRRKLSAHLPVPVLKLRTNTFQQGMVAHTFNSSVWETETGGSEFKATLVYKAEFHNVRATQRKPCRATLESMN